MKSSIFTVITLTILTTLAPQRADAESNREYSIDRHLYPYNTTTDLSTPYSRRTLTRREYIDKYKDIAISEMIKNKIPASITLAQGCLESGNGNSTLSAKSNNHFGIKCGSSWRGRTTRHTDDAPNECFRVYSSAEQSYYDHSKFLIENPRYSKLFQLNIRDYRGWARGLKKAGYATNPKYANLLIDIIEDNNLQQYDKLSGRKYRQQYSSGANLSQMQALKINTHNGVRYVYVKVGDTYQSIADRAGISLSKILKYNDDNNRTLYVGEAVYIQAKRRRAQRGLDTHILKAGETTRSISQYYGIKLKSLYKLNRLPYRNPQLKAGMVLNLRDKKSR